LCQGLRFAVSKNELGKRGIHLFEEEFYDGSSALERRLARQSMVATVGDEVTFRYLPPKSSDLSFYDATKLFDAVSFHMSQFGSLLNCHVTITWRTLGVPVGDHEHAAALLGEYLNRCQKWAAVGWIGRTLTKSPRQRYRARTGEGFRFSYIYVHEYGTEHGFHSHVLCHVPQYVVPAFRAWTQVILPRLARHPGTKKSVVVIPARERSESSTIERQWKWFAYLLKQLNPRVRCGDRNSGQPFVPLREILKVWPYRRGLDVSCAKLTGTSHDLSLKAQKAAGFRSWLRWSRRDGLYLGDELTAGRDRREEEERQRRLAPILATLTTGSAMFDPQEFLPGGKKWPYGI
jgi:hypothetical protein